jgi:hypothetical protein
MIKKTLLGILFICAFVSFITAQDAADNTATASAIVPGIQYAKTQMKAEVDRPYGIGADFTIIERLIPGISFTKLMTTETSYSIFGGLMVDGRDVLIQTDINWYHLFNEYLYVGAGVSASLVPGGYFVLGFANPSVGMLAEITENIKFYCETNITIIRYTSKESDMGHFQIENPVPGLKMGLRYFFN